MTCLHKANMSGNQHIGWQSNNVRGDMTKARDKKRLTSLALDNGN